MKHDKRVVASLAKALRESVPNEALRLSILATLYSDADTAVNNNAARVEFLKALAALADTDGMIGIIVDSTDCDHVRVATAYVIHHLEYERTASEIYSDAEGPTYIQTCTAQEARLFNPPQPRDYLLEAFEDGHSHVVYH